MVSPLANDCVSAKGEVKGENRHRAWIAASSTNGKGQSGTIDFDSII